MRALGCPEDPWLSDEQWNQIATGFMDTMGLATRDDPAGVRWAAVRHGLSRDGIDHVHIVATLARQDGALPSVHNDFIRARKACLAIEQRFGLRVTAPADGTAAPRPARAETEQAQRAGRPEPPRVTLRRIIQGAAATAISEDDFFARVRDAGALVRIRSSATVPGEATGYAVALPPDTAGTRTAVWFGGGKLAPDLTLPKLRRRWDRPGPGRAPIMPAPGERHANWADIVRLTGDGASELRRLSATDPAAAADVAWATADALRSSAAAIGGRPGRQVQKAADDFDRAARQTHRTIPRPTPAGDGLRTASRLLAVLHGAGVRGGRTGQLIENLIQLAEATARLRLAQMRAHQAAAAKATADRLTDLRGNPVLHPQPAPRETAAPGTAAQARPKASAVRVAHADIPASYHLRPAGAQPRPAARPPRTSAARRGRPQGPAP